MRVTMFSIAILVAVFSIVSARPAQAVEAVYMVVIGQSQGQIYGSVEVPGHEGQMEVTRVEHVIETPYDPVTGQPTGRRQHNPFVVRKPVDRATPFLLAAYANSEHLQDVWVVFYRLNHIGQEELYFTVHLMNALIVRYQQALPAEIDPLTGAQSHWEEFACTYERIGWTWEPEGIYMEDSWIGDIGGLIVRQGSEGSSLSMWPNPSSGDATIAFETPANLPAELDILDVAGRMLRQVSSEAGGQHQLAWDGRDAAGRQLPEGTYFLRLSWSGGSASKRVTLIR